MANTFHRVGQGPHPVLVLHGWFGDAHAFEPIEPWLSRERFSYFFMDCRGYGGMRDVPGEYSIDEVAGDALALADELQLDTFSVVGHSMGGMAIERMAVRAPAASGRCWPLRLSPAVALPMIRPLDSCWSGLAAIWGVEEPSSIAVPADACRRPSSSGRPPIR